MAFFDSYISYFEADVVLFIVLIDSGPTSGLSDFSSKHFGVVPSHANEGLYETPIPKHEMILVTGILGGGEGATPKVSSPFLLYQFDKAIPNHLGWVPAAIPTHLNAVCSKPLQHQVEAQGKKIHHKSS